jgi:octaprenyl-diphosphate synthase
MLTLATAALSEYAGEGHIKLAASVEFMHTATLLHDDVVDESDMRRGKLAARMLWGNEASVLVGDFLLGQAFKMMVEVGSLACLDVLSTAAAVIARGRAPVTSVDYRAGRDRRDSASLRHGPWGAWATVAAATAVTGRAFVTRPGGGQGPSWAP